MVRQRRREVFVGLTAEELPGGIDLPTLGDGINMVMKLAAASIPAPPYSTDAPLSLVSAAWVPDGVDRLSALPEDVLRDLLSRLPAKDGARTTALSTRWRRLWHSVPLALVDQDLFPHDEDDDSEDDDDDEEDGEGDGRERKPRDIVSAVSRALAAHPGPFRCAHLTCTAMDAHRGEVARWLHALAVKGVQDLVFMNLPWPLDVPLPASLFSCSSLLTRLHLGVWSFPDTASLPRGAAFPYLRELALYLVRMRDRDLAFVLDRSPVLETLTIIMSLGGVRVRLVSGSLRRVQLCLTIINDFTVVDAPLLERIMVWHSRKSDIDLCSRIRIGHAPNLRVMGFLVPGMHDLEVRDTPIKNLTKGSPSTDVPSVRILALEVKFGQGVEAKMLSCFLRCFPNVETLHVHSHEADKPAGKVNPKFWQEAGSVECVQRHIKKVIFREFRGMRSELAFLRFIAENGQVLEKIMILLNQPSFATVEQGEAKMKVLRTSTRWASKGCELMVYRSPYPHGQTPPWNYCKASGLSHDPFDVSPDESNFVVLG